ncbi:MAG TPA: dihydrodipicolinate reductase C-terminal domain-containing protein [Nitrolancea sp.]|nr:dihydrodipicolinate reductase C-terminal domain-containing protein [Nitrolancea sp.]
MIRIGVAGIAGRMGRIVAPLVVDAPDLQLAGGTIRPGSTPPPEPWWPELLTDRPEELAAACDVVIDFSSPESALAHAAACAAHGCRLVSGTTGFDARQSAELDARSAAIPVFHAANFSLGIAALRQALRSLAVTLATYDVAVIETHHTAKRDAPSGTALLLAQAVEEARGATPAVDLHSLRLGGQPGRHTVIFAAGDEEVSITHQAFGRRAYAAGALLAARFLLRQPPGRYGIDHLLADLAGN